MDIEVRVHTDRGTVKNVNQDAVLLKQAHDKTYGKIVFAVLCDGMGGLACGEVASASLVKRMDKWFKNELPRLLLGENETEQLDECMKVDASGNRLFREIESQWKTIVQEMNIKIMNYGNVNGFSLGTTIVCSLMIQNHFIAMNVGDSRFYNITKDNVIVISHDHSLVQKEIDEGKITFAEAQKSDKKNILLQCIGASEVVVPEFYTGKIKSGEFYLLCSDGLWRNLKAEEIVEISPQKTGLELLTDIVISRGERDNISGIVLKVK